MARPASRKAVSSLPAIANIDEQLDEVVMCNYCGGSGVLDMGDYRIAPSSIQNLCFCPYCQKGQEQRNASVKRNLEHDKVRVNNQSFIESVLDFLDNPRLL